MPVNPPTMRAIIQDGYGAPERVLRLEEIPVPSIGADDVLIRMRATSVNTPDWATVIGVPYILRLGSGLRRPKRPVRGSDVAGVVEAVGQGVTDLAPGDEVFGSTRARAGTFAQYVVAPAAQLIKKPAGLTFTDAAASVMTGLAALVAMRDVAQVGAGTRVLINGASGGVGTMAVQIAKVLGAEVTGVCGTRNVELVRSLGADHVIDYTKEDFSKRAWEISGKKGVDVLVNYTGGDTWVPSLRTLARYGRLLTCGATAGFDPKTDIRYIWRREVNIIGANGWTREDLEALLVEVERGSIKPIIHGVYPLAESREAMRVMEDREVFGKIIVVP